MKKTLIAVLAAAMMAVSMPVFAKYGGARSSFSTTRVSPSRPAYSVPSRPVYRAPTPAYRTPTYSPAIRSNSTTIINQRSGGGFMSNMLSTGAGVLGGMWLFNWLKGDAPAAPAPAVPASAPAVTQ